MPHTTAPMRSLIERHTANCVRIGELADALETRSLTDAEQAEYDSLRRDNSLLEMRMQASQANASAPRLTRGRALAENIARRVESRLVLTRDDDPTPTPTPTTTTSANRIGINTASANETGIIPIQEQEMLAPLRAGMIWDKVGLSIRTGLVGSLRWPTHGKATAYWRAEGERVTESTIAFNKLQMSGEPISCAIDVTREALDDSEGVIASVITSEMPQAIADLVNETLFDTTGKIEVVNNGTTEKVDRAVTGPFVNCQRITFASTTLPTRKELLKMKKAISSAGFAVTHPCWVMTDATKAELEDLKVDAGSGRFVCESDMILGWPVFTTPHIGEGNIGLGDWGYQAAGFFGQTAIVVDPYTLAKSNEISFVLHQRFGTTTLRPEAFVLGVPKPE